MRLLLCIIGLLNTVFVHAKTVYIIPVGGMDHTKVFFDPYSYRDEIAKPFYDLRNALIEKGYVVEFSLTGENIAAEQATAVISFNEHDKKILKNLAKIPRSHCLLFIFEPPVVLPSAYDFTLQKYFGKIFVMFDNLVDNKRYFKLHYPQPRHSVVEQTLDFSEKKLCVLIGGNGQSKHPKEAYTDRRNLVRFFKTVCPNDFDLFGRNWPSYKTHLTPNKWETISKYKFCICYENMKNQYGYITEKIFDAMIGGAVPIYQGASNIEEYVPKSCFIDRRDFASLEKLYHFIRTMDRETHQKYLDSIQTYFKNRSDDKFSIEYFIQTVLRELNKIEKKKLTVKSSPPSSAR